MSNPRCQMSPDFKREVSTEFSTLMQEHGLRFEEQISLITILHIGLPSFGRMWTEAKKRPGIFLLLSRIVSVVVFSTLVALAFFLNPQGSFYSGDPLLSLRLFLENPFGGGLPATLLSYILIPIGMLFASSCFLIMDYILIWASRNQSQARLASWFAITTLMVLGLSPVIAVPVETLLAGFLMMEYVEFWVPLLVGAGIVLLAFIIVSVMTLRAFLSSASPNIVSIEGKYLAIRKCIRHADTTKPFGLERTQLLQNTGALSQLRLVALSKFILLAVLMCSLAVAAGYLPISPIHHDGAVVAAYALVTLVVILSVGVIQAHRLRLGVAMAKSVLDSMMAVAVVLALPALLSDVAVLEVLVVFSELLLTLLYANYVVTETVKSRPDALGYSYYQSHLQSLSGTDAEEFIRSGLEELRSALTNTLPVGHVGS